MGKQVAAGYFDNYIAFVIAALEAQSHGAMFLYRMRDVPNGNVSVG